MARRSRLSVAVLAVLVAVFAGIIVVGPLLGVGVPPEAVALGVVLAVVASLYGFRRVSSGGSVWDAIPRWQYTGRHVESGGLTRDEQEQALQEIQEQAERDERY